MLSQSPLFSTASTGSTPQDSVVFQGITPTLVPVTVQGATGQSADVFDVINSLGSILFSVGPTGNVVIAGSITAVISEVLTGTLTLNGNLSVSGTSTFGGLQSLTTQTTSGVATFNGVITANSQVNINSGLSVTGLVYLTGVLSLSSGSAQQFVSISSPGSNSVAAIAVNPVSGGINFIGFSGAGVNNWRSMIGSDASTTIVQGGTGKGIKIIVNNPIFANNGSLALVVNGASVNGIVGSFYFTPSATTALTASTEYNAYNFAGATYTWANGIIALQRNVIFGQPIYAQTSSQSSTTLAINVDIASPSSGSSNLFTTAYALRVGSSFNSGPQAAGFSYAAISVPTHTLTLGGGNEVTSNDISALRLDVLTITEGSAVTVDSAAALTIVGPPVAAGSVTLTNAYAINVKAGLARFTGGLDLSGIGTTTANITFAATTSTPSTTWSVGVPSNNPTGYMKVSVASTSYYIPYWT